MPDAPGAQLGLRPFQHGPLRPLHVGMEQVDHVKPVRAHEPGDRDPGDAVLARSVLPVGEGVDELEPGPERVVGHVPPPGVEVLGIGLDADAACLAPDLAGEPHAVEAPVRPELDHRGIRPEPWQNRLKDPLLLRLVDAPVLAHQLHRPGVVVAVDRHPEPVVHREPPVAHAPRLRHARDVGVVRRAERKRDTFVPCLREEVGGRTLGDAEGTPDPLAETGHGAESNEAHDAAPLRRERIAPNPPDDVLPTICPRHPA